MASNLLDSISIEGKVVTGDALYCQRRLCERIVSDGGDYLLVVKRNQGNLYEDVEFCFEGSDGTYRYAEARDRHGDRWERRRVCATDMLKGYLDWPGHAQAIKME